MGIGEINFKKVYSMESLTLIDGNYLCHRSIYKGLNLKNSTGLSTGGVFLFLKSLWYFKELGRPIVIFDGGKAAFRKKLLPEYKVREKNESLMGIFSFTFETLQDLLPKMGIPVIRLKASEADDVIYLLAKELKDDFKITVVSEDEDFLQLLKLDIEIFHPRKDETWTRKLFTEKWRFDPEYFSIWKAMIGDTSDKIPGVPNLGFRKIKGLKNKFLVASYIINHLNSPGLEALWDFTEYDQIVGPKIKEHFSLVKRNYLLVDFDHSDVSSEIVLSSLRESSRMAALDYTYTYNIFKKLEFSSLSKWLSYLA